MSKKRYEWIFENGENEIIDNITGQYVTISSPELLNEKDQKIADLEAKLAVADDCADRYWKQLGIVEEENTKLKQQLAMQENTITNLVEDNRSSQEWYKKQLEEKDKEITQRLVIQEKDYNQDKISFCIEQLEKVRELINKNYFYNLSSDSCTFDKLEVDFQIDNQINQLKEMK